MSVKFSKDFDYFASDISSNEILPLQPLVPSLDVRRYERKRIGKDSFRLKYVDDEKTIKNTNLQTPKNERGISSSHVDSVQMLSYSIRPARSLMNLRILNALSDHMIGIERDVHISAQRKADKLRNLDSQNLRSRDTGGDLRDQDIVDEKIINYAERSSPRIKKDKQLVQDTITDVSSHATSDENHNDDALSLFLILILSGILLRALFLLLSRFIPRSEWDISETGQLIRVHRPTGRNQIPSSLLPHNSPRLSILFQRLNARRLSNGERPLSGESFRFLLGTAATRDFDGNDYELLWEFQEENGPSRSPAETITRARETNRDFNRYHNYRDESNPHRHLHLSWERIEGITLREIDQYPSRILSQSDDLLCCENETEIDVFNNCAICLEIYEISDCVRTLPCSHSFHAKCIGEWLLLKAGCPICKKSVIYQ